MAGHECSDPRCSHPAPEVIMESARQNIEEHGYNVMGVLPDDDHYPFTYTTGFGEVLEGHPELVVVGLENHLAHHIIHIIAEEMKRGLEMPPGERVVIEKMPFRLDPVDLSRTWLEFGVTSRYYRGKAGWKLEVMQIVWPDDEYLLPGEHGVDPVCVEAQDPVNLPVD